MMPISPTSTLPLSADQALAELLVRQRLNQDPSFTDSTFDIGAAAPNLPTLGGDPEPKVAPIPMPRPEPVRTAAPILPAGGSRADEDTSPATKPPGLFEGLSDVETGILAALGGLGLGHSIRQGSAAPLLATGIGAIGGLTERQERIAERRQKEEERRAKAEQEEFDRRMKLFELSFEQQPETTVELSDGTKLQGSPTELARQLAPLVGLDPEQATFAEVQRALGDQGLFAEPDQDLVSAAGTRYRLSPETGQYEVAPGFPPPQLMSPFSARGTRFVYDPERDQYQVAPGAPAPTAPEPRRPTAGERRSDAVARLRQEFGHIRPRAAGYPAALHDAVLAFLNQEYQEMPLGTKKQLVEELLGSRPEGRPRRQRGDVF